MISFYKYLKSGKQKNEALQLAKLDYLKNTNDAELKHPFYWAGFVVSGDIEPITNSNRKWPYAISSIFLIGFVFRKRLFQLFN